VSMQTIKRYSTSVEADVARGAASFVFWNAVNPFRCASCYARLLRSSPVRPIHGRPFDASVSPLEAPGSLSALTLSCYAQKASDLPSWQIPFDVYVSPCFSRPE
jgi:hypothetical protein